MKLFFAFLILAAAKLVHGRNLQSLLNNTALAQNVKTNTTMKSLPVMTFFIPFPEEKMYFDLFSKINNVTIGPKQMVYLLAITISTDKTVLWLDHWEDGYDLDVTVQKGRSTQIWGDGNCANGYAASVTNCTSNADDVLMAGTSVIVRDYINVPRIVANLRYDGGDRLQSSFPVTVTRVAYPLGPSQYFGGAVQVFDTTQWGRTFEAPVGSDTKISSASAFEFSAFICMAGENNTEVTLPDGSVVPMIMGESVMVPVNQSDRIVSNKPIQVVLLTGDIGSMYETRWFTMRSIEMYQKSYVTPVGDDYGKTRVVLYNPGPADLTYSVKVLVNGTARTETNILGKKQSVYTRIIPTGSGAWIDGDNAFVALSVTDTEEKDLEMHDSKGEKYDWGFAMIPRNELTSQVVIGMGFGCINGQCPKNETVRSPVWISPVEDADIYIDYQNTGVDYKMIPAKALESIKVVDTDADMSGATIFAVRKGETAKDGNPVDIAVAWGQDPSVSWEWQELSQDFGTVVAPYTLVKVAKIVDKLLVAPGEELLYTIRVSNVGHKNVNAGSLTVKDVLDRDVTYVPGSTKITIPASSSGGTATAIDIADAAGGKFVVSEANGFVIPIEIPRRGGTVDIVFKVKVAATIDTKSKIINRGSLIQVGGGTLPFEATSAVNFGGAIKIDNTVYVGSDGGAKCGTNATSESVSDFLGTGITYCYRIENTGKVRLGNITITSPELKSSQVLSGIILEPGAVRMIPTVNLTLTTSLINTAIVVGTPLFSNGNPIPDVNKPTAADPAQVTLLAFTPRIAIENVVYIGNDNGARCNVTTADQVSDIAGTIVTYCFKVTNTGDSWLKNVWVKDAVLAYNRSTTDGLNPKQTRTYFVTRDINGTTFPDNVAVENIAEVTAIATTSDWRNIPGGGDVKASDPSSVVKLVYKPRVVVENTVYLGRDGGKQCGTPAAVEFVSDFFGNNVTHCIKISNVGDTPLTRLELINTQLGYTNRTLGNLTTIGSSISLFIEGRVNGNVQNFANVSAIPLTPDGRRIPELNGAGVWAIDPAEVGQRLNAPSISVDNTVAIGNLDASTCSAATSEFVEDFTGTNVTYCFTIKNTGDTFLSSITVSNPNLSFVSAVVERLAPGATRTIAVPRSIMASIDNLVTVTAKPTLSDGRIIPNVPDVTATDPSRVIERLVLPNVTVSNKVYLGTEQDAGCALAGKRVEDKFGTLVTYCFNITNTGNTHLNNIRLTDDALSFADQTSVRSLAPGGSALVTVSRRITASSENTVIVTGRPIKSDGTILATGEVSASDPSSVGRIPHQPNVVVNNTVYIGSPGSCFSLGTESVTDIYLTDIVYCFKITNTGNSHLNNITIVNAALNYSESLGTKILEPGETTMIPLPSKIVRDLLNTAVVTANPILRDGTDIADIPDVSHLDTSSVQKLSLTGSVSIANTVYQGRLGGAGCNRSTEVLPALFGSNVTYCFAITNTGPTHLRNIVLASEELAYNERLINRTLAPGATMLITLPGIVTATRNNMVSVSATPTTANGREILDAGTVTSSDPSGVELTSHTPNVTIANKVYLGDDDGKGCSTNMGSESVKEQYGAAVTYCFKVTNIGNSFLDNIAIGNEVLGYTYSPPPGTRLAPWASITVSVPGKILGNLTNVATVTANPCTADGTDIPQVADVRATDPSAVIQIAHKSGVNVINNVYLTSTDPSCSSGNVSNVITDYPQTPVTYCFAIKNVGESYLKDIVLSNVELSINDATSIRLLAPGETKVIPFPSAIMSSLNNTAIVTGTPCLADGTLIPNVPIVRATDPSGVMKVDYAPRVEIENSVYSGVDGSGQKCGTSAARDSMEGLYNAPVTYCFKVTNKGDTPLGSIVVVNTLLNFQQTLSRTLAPGDSEFVFVERTITSDLTNNAVVTAQPTIAGLAPVQNEDTSNVNKLDFVGGVMISNTVYLGAGDNGAKCGQSDVAVEKVEGLPATAVTYCFTVTNVGDASLDDVVITNEQLNYTTKLDGRLAPGKSFTRFVTGQIGSSNLLNIAKVSGNPVTADGVDIPDLETVRNEDPSEVIALNLPASVQIQATVYAGRDGGAKCNTPAAVEYIAVKMGTNVTYCFTVVNTGSTHLRGVRLNVSAVTYRDNIDRLAPGANKTFFVSTPLTSLSVNVNATVVGAPSLPDGTIIPNRINVTSWDPATVERLPPNPRIEIQNLVTLGHDEEKCRSAVEYVEQYPGTPVTYCFVITNKGDTHLRNITLMNPALAFNSTNAIPLLAPGESQIVAYRSTITKSVANTAIIRGTPANPDGRNMLNVTDVTWSDGSAVGVVPYKPNVSVNNTVYIGNDQGASCSSKGVESVTGLNGTGIVYCFTVTNIGDTYLNQISLSNAVLNYTTVLGPGNAGSLLAPNASTVIALVSSLSTNITNHVIVTANPSLVDGTAIVDTPTVSATDSSFVIVQFPINKETPAPNNNATCLEDKWKFAGQNKSLVCSTKQVYFETISAVEPKQCVVGERINITLDTSKITVEGSRNDIGWYIATDGGDGLTGKCYVNGLVAQTYNYTVKPGGQVSWLKQNGGDDDECGDVVAGNNGIVSVTTPTVSTTTKTIEVACTDENDDGKLDVAICFTWRTGAMNKNECRIQNNIPGSDCSCFCSRYDINRTTVGPPVSTC